MSKSKRCLVTGHRGYIGSRLFAALQAAGHEVIGIDVADGHDINVCLFEQHPDFQNSEWFKFRPEYIFHLACIPRVAYSVEQPVTTMLNNVLAGSNVLNFAKKVEAKRVIYSSSSSIVGNGDGPTNPYGLQKMTTEIETKLYSQLYGIDTVALRYFNVYSEDQKASGPYATAICNWMQFIRDGRTPFITGDGEQRRDMLHVDDAISANIFAMEYDGKFDGQHYDCGTGSNISLNEVKDIVQSHFPKVDFRYVGERPGDVLLTKAKSEDLKKIGWQTKINISEGINNCFSNLKGEIKC